MIITIRNDFHGTESRIRVKALPAVLTDSQVRRVRRELCGMADCRCGGVLNQRGQQDVWIDSILRGDGSTWVEISRPSRNTMRISKDMIDRVRHVIKNYDSDSEEYFRLRDFLAVARATEVYYPVEHVKRIAWVFCTALSGREECEIFGLGEHFCPLASLPALEERRRFPRCPLAPADSDI